VAKGGPNGGTIVEIGAYLGSSTAYIASALGERGKRGDIAFYTIDTWQNTAMTEGERNTYAEFLANIAPWGNRVRPLRGFSYDIARDWRKPVDMLFIDADHSYEAVRRDIADWAPWVKV
jgi:predicted O-methyltransferase YrrM